MDLKKALNSVGKTSFIKYYYEYKAYAEAPSESKKQELAKKLLEENPNAKAIEGQYIRIENAASIFTNKMEKDALTKILDANVTEVIKQRTRELRGRI
ncbi:MAG: hypothetical protein ACRC68_09555 [Clostridium sp.]